MKVQELSQRLNTTMRHRFDQEIKGEARRLFVSDTEYRNIKWLLWLPCRVKSAGIAADPAPGTTCKNSTKGEASRSNSSKVGGWEEDVGIKVQS